MYVDGIVSQRGSKVGLVVVSPERIIIEKSLRLGFSATNNEVKYKALLVGIAMVQKMGGRTVEMFSDLRLVVGQVKGELEARDLWKPYRRQILGLLSPYSRILVAQYAKGSTGVRKKVRPMSEICFEYPSVRGSPQSSV